MNCDVDLCQRFSHKTKHILISGIGSGQGTQSQQHLLNEEVTIMDTKSLDKQSREHFQFYNNFMLAIIISIVVIVTSLAIMAATLV